MATRTGGVIFEPSTRRNDCGPPGIRDLQSLLAGGGRVGVSAEIMIDSANIP